MKKFFLSILCITMFCTLLAAASLVGKKVYISTEIQELKVSTGYFSQVKGTMGLGDSAQVVEENGKWVKIQSAVKPTLVGWVPATAITTKRIKSNSNVTASAKETSLAGKGWNKEVEAEYSSENKLNFDAIDAMEKKNINKKVLFAFINDGSLEVGE